MIDDSLAVLGFTMLIFGAILLCILLGILLTAYASFAQVMAVLTFVGIVCFIGGGMLVWCFLLQ